MPEMPMTGKFSATTRRWVLAGLAVGGAVALYTVRELLVPFTLAVLLAYLLNPLVVFTARVTKRSRTSAVALVYLALLAALVLALVLLIPTLVRQIRAIDLDLNSMSAQLRDFTAAHRQVELFGFSLDLFSLYGELQGTMHSAFSFLLAKTGGVLVGVASSMAWFLLILIATFYLLKDADSIRAYLLGLVPEGRQDLLDIAQGVNAILSAYLRGRLVLCMVIGVVTWATMALVGLPNALLMGLIAGVLEIIPNLGPVLATIPAVLIALYQGSAHVPISNPWFALVVLGLYTLIQQLENAFLVPKIIGESVNLHPLVVLFGILVGASLAGVVGIFLAVPAIATGRILASYLFKKLA
ncbi:MAG: AI-2E family transporter [Chloroflexi bacterium]|nr:AI-2E family transporter [Chloroflexota bacterium]